MTDSKYLDRLRELTPQLSHFPPAIIERPGYVEWETKAGKCFGWALFNIPQVAVLRSFMTKGCIFPKHNHSCKEILIVYEGKIVVYTATECFEVETGGFHVNNPNEDHAVEAIEETMLIAVTIPADKDYPDDWRK